MAAYVVAQDEITDPQGFPRLASPCSRSLRSPTDPAPVGGFDSTPVDWLAPFWVRGYDAMLVTVVAHEWSHHVTHILGQIEHSEREELRADCHARHVLGLVRSAELLEPGDLEEAVAISLAAGTQGHGTGQQRAEALLKGYTARGFAECGREL